MQAGFHQEGDVTRLLTCEVHTWELCDRATMEADCLQVIHRHGACAGVVRPIRVFVTTEGNLPSAGVDCDPLSHPVALISDPEGR
jgi:hypothetical protein